MKNILKNKPRRSDCPIANTLDVLGDRWTLLIIRDMMFLGREEFGELMDHNEKIATNILSDRLRRLHTLGIVTKLSDMENKKKFKYKLTEKGMELLPLMVDVILWGMKHIPNADMPNLYLDAIYKDRKQFESGIMEQWESSAG